MNMYITSLYGISPTSTITLAHHNISKIARRLGFTELSIFCYPVKTDTKDELRKRLDGITSALWEDDIVIFQSPSCNGIYYDMTFLKTVRLHKNIRLAILIHDVIPMMDGLGEKAYQHTIDIYNMADLLIVPSERMAVFLRKKGLTVEKILIQPMWDLPFSGELKVPEFKKEILFSGPPERFRFIYDWNFDVPLRLFSKDKPELDKQNVDYEGYKNTSELLTEYTKGGFGLVWEQTFQSEYYKYNQPYKLPTYLAAGIPVIMQKGLVHEQTVLEYGLGFVASTLEEAVDLVKNISEEEYFKMVDNIKNISFLIRNGFFTTKLLLDAVNYMLLD